MPPVVAAAAIAGGASIAGGVMGSRAQSGASRRAAQTQAKADADALAFQREQEETRRREFEMEQAEQKRQFDVQQANTEEDRQLERRLLFEREARLAPRRAAQQAALMKMGDLLGIRFNASTPAVPPPGGAPMTVGQRPDVSRPMTQSRLLPPQAPPMAATEQHYSPVLTMSRLAPSQARRY